MRYVELGDAFHRTSVFSVSSLNSSTNVFLKQVIFGFCILGTRFISRKTSSWSCKRLCGWLRKNAQRIFFKFPLLQPSLAFNYKFVYRFQWSSCDVHGARVGGSPRFCIYIAATFVVNLSWVDTIANMTLSVVVCVTGHCDGYNEHWTNKECVTCYITFPKRRTVIAMLSRTYTQTWSLSG